MPSHSIDLRENQRQLLRTVLNEYEQRDRPVTARTLAAALDRSSGTVRNRMQELLMLGLVESTAGRRGGYAPTTEGYHALGRDPETDSREVTLANNDERVSVPVESIRFVGVNDPDACRAWIRFRRTVTGVEVGDPVAVGPTPGTGLVVAGTVHARDDADTRLLVSVTRMEGPLTDRR